MKLRRYTATEGIPFGHLTIRDMTPNLFTQATMTEVEVPVGADNPPYAALSNDKVYVGVSGDIEFNVEGEAVRVRRGDVLVINRGEQYRYHNGGYELGRLFVIQVPQSAGEDATDQASGAM